jgi:hypothetical protein
MNAVPKTERCPPGKCLRLEWVESICFYNAREPIVILFVGIE